MLLVWRWYKLNKFVYADDDVVQILEFIVLKHGSHNQSTHGNWATGGEGQKVTSLIDELYEKKTPGFSINIKSRRTPKTGFMCSEQGFEKRIKATDFYSSRDVARKYLVEYMQKNAEPLSKRGAYFGAWVEKGKVYLDVSRRYESRLAGVDAGVKNEQKAIYDVSNDSFIYIGDESGQTNKAVTDRSSETNQSDDGRGIERIRRRDFERDGQVEDDDFNPLEEFTLTVHTANGRSLGIKPGEFVTQKHQQHDQSTHGSWASFSGDSSLLARNGAKEFAEQNNIKQNKSIAYKDVVANRARASKIADAYDELPDFDKEAVDEFESLGREVNKQYDFMTRKLGVKVEFVSNDPYKTSKEMFADVSKKTLKVLSTKSTGGHPVFTDEQNDRFRAVHDFFGHAATGRGFGQDGEEAAWVHHSQMFTPKARLALTTETRGQNSWYNTRKNGFAKQKVALLPDEFVLVPETFEKHSTHDQSSHAGDRGKGNKNPKGEQEVTDPNAPKPELKPGRKPDASGSLEERADKLANGERIQVTKSEAKKIMKIMARREDDPDLTNMHIENTLLYDEDNLNIPRNKMPQVPSDTKAVFIAEMEKRGTRIQRGVADPAKLHPIQKEISASKVGKIMKRLREKGMKTGDDGRIVISKDNYVIDGHHRWAAAAMLSFEDSSVKIPVIRVDMNHKDLISATLAWNKASGIQPIGLGEENPNSTFKKWAEFDAIVAKAVRGRTVIRFQPGLKPVIKHQSGNHDQESHGNWAGYPDELISKLGDVVDKARTDLYKKKIKMGIPTYAGNAHIDSLLIKQLLNTGEIKLTKTQIEELRVDQKNIDKLHDNRWGVEEQWYDDHFVNKNNNPNSSLGMSPEMSKIRDEYVAGVGNNEVMIATNRGLRKTGRVTSRVERFDQMVATGFVKEPVILWRSAILPKEIVDSLQKGSSFIDKGFQSTGTTKKTAFSYAEIRYDQQKYEGTPVVFKMKVNKGVGAVDVGYGETVLQRNTKMSITNIKSGPKINILSESAPFNAKGPAFVVVEVEVDKA